MTTPIYFTIATIVFFIFFALVCYLPNHYDWIKAFKIRDESDIALAAFCCLVAALGWIVIVILAIPIAILASICYFMYKYIK